MFTYRSSYEKEFLKIEFLFNNTQFILLNIVLLRTSLVQNDQTVYQGDLRKTRHVQQITSNQIYNQW